MKPLLPCLLLPLLLLAASGHAEERLAYACDNGERLLLSFGDSPDGRPQATIHQAAGDIVLPQVAAASGARYRADPVDLNAKGDEVLFDDGQGRQLRCARGTPPVAVAPAPTTASSFITLTGNVGYRSRKALPPAAILTIRVQDIARASAPARVLAEQRYELNGAQVPVPFTATIDRDLLGKKAKVTVSARIESKGRLLFINDRSYLALANGQVQPLDIQLKPVAGAKGG